MNLLPKLVVLIVGIASIDNSALAVSKAEFFYASFPASGLRNFYLKLKRLEAIDEESQVWEDKVCEAILKSPFFALHNRVEVVDPVNDEGTHAQLRQLETNLNVSQRVYQLVNVSVLQNVTRESVFPCVARLRGTNERKLYLVSHEYDFNRWLRKSTPTKCPRGRGRFVFEYSDKGGKTAHLTAVAEEAARRRAYKANKFEPFIDFKHDGNATSERGRAICNFTSARKVRICAVGLSAKEYRSEIAFLPVAENEMEPECEKRRFAFRYEFTSLYFSEWVIGCRVELVGERGASATYYVSLGYEPYQFLIYHPEKGEHDGELLHHFYSYLEEIFLNSKKAFWSSADGSLLLYASFNDTAVANLEFPWVEEDPRQHNSLKVPTTRSVRYPMPGTNIPEVKLWIVNITKSNTNCTPMEVRRPSLLHNQDYYLASAGWVNRTNTRIAIVWMSRTHNFSYVTYCEAPTWTCQENYREAAATNMWLEIQHQPIFAPDGQSYLLLGPVQENGQQYFTQIKHITLEDEHMRVITYGRHDVLQILAWDTVNHNVYYLGMDESNTGEQHLYEVNDQTVGDTVRPQTRCVTCEVRHHYENCSHFNVYFPSPNLDESAQYYVIECDERPMPVAGVHFLKNHTLRKIIYSHNKHSIGQYAIPKPIFHNILLPKGYTARVQLLMPPSWRPELRDAAFPVIVQVDGRPNSQLVSRKWQTNWGVYMSGRKGVIYIKLDVRGSRGQSSPDLYRLLGDVEVEDQIFVIRKLLNMHKYLDKNRFGVWGWGYGGYTATMLMNSQYNVFKCGIAVAPISDWRYYNAAFTEKILGLKTVSNEGYMRSDLKTKTNFIASDSFYIIQGLADLSVPYQHGIMLANALTRSSKLFKHQVYANEGHELVNVLNHMYRTMEHHFTQCLALEEDDFPNHV